MDVYVGEIRIFAGSFAPLGWALCQGQQLPIVENDVLYALIGTTYGGDGVNTFALPDLRGRAPVHPGTLPGGSTYSHGQMGGVERVTLTTNQLPAHSHTVPHGGAGTQASPIGHILGHTAARDFRYAASAAGATTLASTAVTAQGSGQSHENRSPYMALNFIIALAGIFPSRN
jgi:microcystin-dependent protein